MNLTFDLAENTLADAVEKLIYVRIKDSKGNLIQNKESGTFTNLDQNISSPYTQKQTVLYSNKAQKIVVPISIIGAKLEKGNYVAEVFCDGHFSGIKNLSIK